MSEHEEKGIKDILQELKKHNKKTDTKLVMKAYNYAVSHHGDQKRKSGEPYIIHPVQVAYILSTLAIAICKLLIT